MVATDLKFECSTNGIDQSNRLHDGFGEIESTESSRGQRAHAVRSMSGVIDVQLVDTRSAVNAQQGAEAIDFSAGRLRGMVEVQTELLRIEMTAEVDRVIAEARVDERVSTHALNVHLIVTDAGVDHCGTGVRVDHNQPIITASDDEVQHLE